MNRRAFFARFAGVLAAIGIAPKVVEAEEIEDEAFRPFPPEWDKARINFGSRAEAPPTERGVQAGYTSDHGIGVSFDGVTFYPDSPYIKVTAYKPGFGVPQSGQVTVLGERHYQLAVEGSDRCVDLWLRGTSDGLDRWMLRYEHGSGVVNHLFSCPSR